MGLGKAIALRTDWPQLVVPTSYAGSEMTSILGETQDGAKTTKRDAKIRPESVIYDHDLLATLPPNFAATPGMNAIAHSFGVKMGLKDFGMKEADLDRTADIAAAKPYPNPRAFERTAIRKLLDNVFHGRRPI